MSRPPVTRRRELATGSARSLLMTLLGEYVLPRARPTWTSTVVQALATLGIEEKAARQALTRSSAEGWIVSERVGRRVRWTLTDQGHRLLTEGAARIYAFGRATPAWDGRWLVLLLTVPEPRRDLRQRLRTRLTWAGFGSPDPGVWISPHPAREPEAAAVLHDLGLHEALSFTAAHGAIGSEPAMVARAWDLSTLEARYEDFVADFGSLHPEGDAATLRAQTRLVHAWRRFPFLDPQLPRELLPEEWSGAKAVEVFHTRHAEWDDAARHAWEASDRE
ncbi:PaaX family transcriptional regulator C-terminal domain-containing protein [Catenulispora subtropica]|uniref:PaaX family transcriptional regulator C-terminal domain-containing protein n=1 Tax=Catenulispora subtropica TaxID=450798 RepID=A0ABP5CPE4_9ACTN